MPLSLTSWDSRQATEELLANGNDERPESASNREDDSVDPIDGPEAARIPQERLQELWGLARWAGKFAPWSVDRTDFSKDVFGRAQLKIWHNLEQLERATVPQAWMRRVVANTAIEYRRELRRRRDVPVDPMDLPEPDTTHATNGLGQPGADPLTILIDKEEEGLGPERVRQINELADRLSVEAEKLLDDGLSQLRARHRDGNRYAAILVCRYRGGQSFDAIAGQLGLDANYVEHLRRNAVRELLQILDERDIHQRGRPIPQPRAVGTAAEALLQLGIEASEYADRDLVAKARALGALRRYRGLSDAEGKGDSSDE
jgi:DNA-directed RNA polymerase specialized sigma24 family protein